MMMTSVSVITHDVLPDCKADYERWMQTALAAHQRFAGYLSTDIVRPAGVPHRYVIMVRFETDVDAEGWLESTERKSLLQCARPWLSTPEQYVVHQSSAFWFQLQNHPVPRRWKQWLLSSVTVFPLTSLVPTMVATLLGVLGLDFLNRLFGGAVSAATISAAMVYWLVPLLSRWTARWLYA